MMRLSKYNNLLLKLRLFLLELKIVDFIYFILIFFFSIYFFILNLELELV